MTATPWPKGTYLKNNGSSLCFDPAVHDGASLLASGYSSYEPLSTGGDLCTDSHAWLLSAICPHNQTWFCEQAPRERWNPLATDPKFRDQNWVNAHRDEIWAAEEAAEKAGQKKQDGPSLDDTARTERFKAARQGGATWVEIFAKEDVVGGSV